MHKANSQRLREVVVFFPQTSKFQQQQQNIIRHTKKQGSTTQSKQHNKSPENDPKAIQSYELPENGLKVTINKMLTELKHNTNRQLNEIRKTVHEKMKILTKR